MECALSNGPCLAVYLRLKNICCRTETKHRYDGLYSSLDLLSAVVLLCQSRVRSEDGRVARIGRIPYNAVDYR